jgi:hypothetical protein
MRPSFRASVLEMDAPASDQHLVVRTVCQVRDFGWHLIRQANQIRCPSTLRHNPPTLPAGYGARGLVYIRAQFSPERQIDLGNVIEAAPNPPNLSTLSEACEGDIDHGSACNIQEILR